MRPNLTTQIAINIAVMLIWKLFLGPTRIRQDMFLGVTINAVYVIGMVMGVLDAARKR